MEKKKYVLKSDNLEQEKSADGTENSEHVFDMIDRAEMCLSNIQDNTDLCMNIYKLSKQTLSEDEIDAMQLLCEENISIEQSAGEIAMQRQYRQTFESNRVKGRGDFKTNIDFVIAL